MVWSAVTVSLNCLGKFLIIIFEVFETDSEDLGDENTLVSDAVLFLGRASRVHLCNFSGGFRRTGKFRGSHQDAQVPDVHGVGVSPVYIVFRSNTPVFKEHCDPDYGNGE
jgi:hypothetical protein